MSLLICELLIKANLRKEDMVLSVFCEEGCEFMLQKCNLGKYFSLSNLAPNQLSFPKYKPIKLVENSFQSLLLLRHKVLTEE